MNLRSLRTLLLLAITLTMALPAGAQADGDPDTSFGATGSLDLNLVPGYSQKANDVAIDPQGKILVAGTADLISSSYQSGFIARLLPNGDRDTTFTQPASPLAPGVVAIASGPGTRYRIYSIDIDSKGRIVFAGDMYDSDYYSDLIVGRLLPNGNYDPSFSGDGIDVLDVKGVNKADRALDVTTDSANRVIISGNSDSEGDSHLLVARYTEAGALDATFGSSGLVQLNRSQTFGKEVVSVPGGYLVGGTFGYNNERAFLAMRLKENGTLDSTFSDDGLASVDFGFPAGNQATSAMRIDSDGRVLLAGQVNGLGSAPGIGLARLTPTGVPDPAFSGDGKVLQATSDSLSVQSAAIDPTGRIATVGAWNTVPQTASQPLIARFTPGGDLDTAFLGGISHKGLGLTAAESTAIEVDSQGRYIVAGHLTGSNSDVLLSRLNVSYPVVTPPPPPPPPPPAKAVKCAGAKATIIGTASKDKLNGTKKRDVIAALGGNDVIKGLGGNDLICGGAGNDKLVGGPGKDVLRGEAGKDKLLGGPGKDKLLGGGGKDRCVTGPVKGKLTGCERH